MANGVRRWLPPVLIVAAIAASIGVYLRVPVSVPLRLDGVLPFDVSGGGRTMTRAGLFLVPAAMLLIWIAFRSAPTAAGQRLGRKLFRRAPEAATDPAQFERFRPTYDTIVLGVVGLMAGLHAAMLLAFLGYAAAAARVIPVVLGAALVMIGNVMPRLRPNWVAGLRTRRMLESPELWRGAHRTFGTAFVLSGLLTIAVGLLAPEYGLVTGIAAILVSCIVGFVASTRVPAAPPVA